MLNKCTPLTLATVLNCCARYLEESLCNFFVPAYMTCFLSVLSLSIYYITNELQVLCLWGKV